MKIIDAVQKIFKNMHQIKQIVFQRKILMLTYFFLSAILLYMNDETNIHEKAERIRDVIRYIHRFKNALVIIYLDDTLIDSPIFMSHIKDICLIHEAGLKVIIVPGSSKRIDEILKTAQIEWTFHNNYRITAPEAMPLIKMAAFDVSNTVMTALAGEKKTAVIGNWVRARGKGVIDGFDYATIGEIDKLEMDAIETVLQNGFIPIFPCIGWSVAGKPYNISSIQLAEQIASHLKADKLFYLVPNVEIDDKTFIVPKSIGLSSEGRIPALNLEEVELFLSKNENSNNRLVNSGKKINEQSVNFANSNEQSVVLNHETEIVSREKIFSLLRIGEKACKAGVTRVHILNGSLEGTIPCEIFSDLGSGTMIYANNYGRIRDMTRSDISAVLNIMKPFVAAGILLPRTKQMLLEQFPFYIVYELDGAIRACASLIPYTDGQMEIAGVAVDKNCSNIGIGPKMIEFLVKRAREVHSKGVFLLTTQTADWFEHQGFTTSDISTLPEKRRKAWTPQRGSKVLRLDF